MDNENKLKRVTIKIPDALYKKLRIKVIEEDTTVQYVVQKLIHEYLGEEKEEKRVE